MKVFIASDLHGSFYYVNQLIEQFNSQKGDLLILLGDILYHGPRNDLPKDYAPKKVIELLNQIADKIVCVKGNCDAEVDDMVLKFDLASDYKSLTVNGTTLHLTHGHKYNPNAPIPFAKQGEVVLFGHSHIPCDCIVSKVRYLNPGSVSIPKENSSHGYILLEGNSFTFNSL